MCAIKGTFMAWARKFGLNVFEAKTFEITCNYFSFHFNIALKGNTGTKKSEEHGASAVHLAACPGPWCEAGEEEELEDAPGARREMLSPGPASSEPALRFGGHVSPFPWGPYAIPKPSLVIVLSGGISGCRSQAAVGQTAVTFVFPLFPA